MNSHSSLKIIKLPTLDSNNISIKDFKEQIKQRKETDIVKKYTRDGTLVIDASKDSIRCSNSVFSFDILDINSFNTNDNIFDNKNQEVEAIRDYCNRITSIPLNSYIKTPQQVKEHNLNNNINISNASLKINKNTSDSSICYSCNFKVCDCFRKACMNQMTVNHDNSEICDYSLINISTKENLPHNIKENNVYENKVKNAVSMHKDKLVNIKKITKTKKREKNKVKEKEIKDDVHINNNNDNNINKVDGNYKSNIRNDTENNNRKKKSTTCSCLVF